MNPGKFENQIDSTCKRAKHKIDTKQIRNDFKLNKGSKLLIVEEKGKITIKPIKLDEKHILMLLSETSLKKTWDNKYDERWDDVL